MRSTSICRTRYDAFVLFALGLSGFASGAGYGTIYDGGTIYISGPTSETFPQIFIDEGSALSGRAPVAIQFTSVFYNGNTYPAPAGGTNMAVKSINGFNCDTLFYTTYDVNTGTTTARTAFFTGTGFTNSQELPPNSSFGASSGDPIATLDYVNSSGFYQGALYSTVDGSIKNVNTNSLGVYAGPISNGSVSSFHSFFPNGGGYSYQDELHFGLTDLNPTAITLASGYTSAELTSIDGASAVGSVGIVAPDFSYLGEEPAYWGLDLNGHNVGNAIMLPNNGTTGIANGVNASGYIVGTLNGRAVLWKKDGSGTYQAIDLNTLIASNSGWVLDFGETILEDGTILGVGTYNGQSAIFELTPTPTPEPASMCVLGIGVAALARRSRRRNRAALPVDVRRSIGPLG